MFNAVCVILLDLWIWKVCSKKLVAVFLILIDISTDFFFFFAAVTNKLTAYDKQVPHDRILMFANAFFFLSHLKQQR